MILNFTQTLINPNISEVTFERNESSLFTQTFRDNRSSLLKTEIEILGPPVFWIFSSLTAVQGIVSVFGNFITLVAIYKSQELLENNACKFIASLTCADFLGRWFIFFL